MNEEEYSQYIYSKGYHDVDFFINFFLDHYKKDKKTGETIQEAPFHRGLRKSLKNSQDTLVIVPRDHAKSTTNFFVLIHDICYAVEPSILLIMAKGLWLETIGKIRDEFETNWLIKKVFGRLVPERTRQEANKKWTQNQLQFLNGVTIESVTMWWSIRGKRPTKIVVDDPQENSDVQNRAVTDKFNYWFWSSVYNTLDPSGKCVVIGTVVWSLCLVNHILQEWRGFEAIKYEAIDEPEYKTIDWKKHIVWWKTLWPAKWSIETLNDRMQTIWEDVFMQEYMNRPMVALWSPVFKHSALDEIKTLTFIDEPMRPGLQIYWKASNMCIYGVDTSLWDAKWDYSAIVVRDSDYSLLAVYRAHIAPDELCKVIDCLWQMWYKWDIAIESNNTGIATLHEAREYERSWYLYKTEVFDKVTNQTTQKVWWNTNMKTRPAMIENHKKLFYSNTIKEFDKRQLDEMRYFYYNERGKPEAVAPHHDDLVISDMICCKIINDLYW